MSLYQTLFPELMLCFEKLMTPPLEFASKITRVENPFHRIPLTWQSTGEEDIGMTAMLNDCASAWGYLFPLHAQRYFEKYILFQNKTEEETKSWKDAYLYLLKKLSLANHSKPLVLKNPPNTARIKLLLSLFPDARFILIYRNPYDVFASTKRMLAMIRRKYMLGKNRGVNDDEIILKTYSGIMNRYLEEKSLVIPDRLNEISYEQFTRSPVECLRQVYESLRLEDFSSCEKAMNAFCSAQNNYTVLNHRLSEEETKTVSNAWEPFIRHWNYPLL
jgi:hypothetical protein